MDRFKFRVYVTENDAYPEKVGYVNTEDFYIHPDGEESYFNADYDFAESVIEQCTGLNDKNGKLIYEGDIVKDLEGYKGEVSYDETSGKFIIEFESDVSDFLNDDSSELEVIGNIHQNKELLDD